ncbi:MAG: RsmD family RNA methyltransferase [Bacteroidota bacterium]|nr:RsmD family RNA methyltransferase [Bacteroidota bacterium]
MRIIAGSRKGHVIRAPHSLPIRPTTDRSKEALFGILTHHFEFEECSALDLFSGGGGISLEFASRDIEHVTAVDKHAGCVKFLREEARKLGFENIDTNKADVMQFIRNTTERYDIIFCDPPFAFTRYEEMIQVLIEREVVTGKGWIIVEHHSVKDFPQITHRFDRRAYGQNIMSLFALNPEEQP